MGWESAVNWKGVDRPHHRNHPGAGIGARHITVSTVGIIEHAGLAASHEQFRLAISCTRLPERRLA
jgi:adenine C2-methylase RlmN of 23S rRNA A2503 and tRNA A37